MDKFLESILKDDIEGICRICVEAEDERKNDIGNIIDAIYLLSQSSQSDLRRVYNALQKELDMNVNERGQRAAKLLGVTPGFIGVKNLGEEVKQKTTAAEKALEQTKICCEAKMIPFSRWGDCRPDYKWPPLYPRLSFPV